MNKIGICPWVSFGDNCAKMKLTALASPFMVSNPRPNTRYSKDITQEWEPSRTGGQSTISVPSDEGTEGAYEKA